MSNSSSKPLPQPWSVGKDAALYFKFARMTPDEIRAHVRSETEAGRAKYEDLFYAACRALGPDAPEVAQGRPITGSTFTVARVEYDDMTSYLRHHLGSGYIFEMPGGVMNDIGSWEDMVVREPETGFLPERPTLAEVTAMHERAAPKLRAMREAAKAAYAERQAKAASEKPST